MPSRLGQIGLITALWWLAGFSTATAQVITPKLPEKYDAQIRYRILADRNERVLIYEQMSKYFASLGFVEKFDEDNDLAAFDVHAEMMLGTIPSKDARKLIDDRRVQTVILAPAGFKIPEDSKQRVRVSLTLNSNQDQLLLFKQTRTALAALGFEADIGYDPKRFTLLIGTIPAAQLPKLIRDLRAQPSGWVLTDPPAELLQRLPDGTGTPNLVRPFADTLPVRVVEVLSVAEAPPAIVKLPPIAPDQKFQEKLTSDLRRKLAEDGVKDAPLRVEIVLSAEPSEIDTEWRVPLVQAGASIEGRIGSVVSVTLPTGGKAFEMAAQEQIVSIRLPRSARVVVTDLVREPKKEEPKKEEPKKEEPKKEAFKTEDPKKVLQISADELQLPKASPDDDPLKNTGLDRLHAINRKGQGVHVVILDTDFAGWEQRFPKPKPGSPVPKFGQVNFLDLTAERQRDVMPDEMPGEFGSGTNAALAVRLAAPLANITLVRIPADAPYQLINVGRYVRGDQFRSEGLNTRRNELAADFEEYQNRRKKANEEYRAAFTNFDEDPKAEKRRVDSQKALEKLDVEEKGLHGRMDRIDRIEIGLNMLKGANVVVGLLSWNTGFALDAASPMSRFLDDWLAVSKPMMKTRRLTRPTPDATPVWFQPAGDQRGQTWTGLFADADNNGAMEFAPTTESLLPGRWNRELNFIGVEQDGKDLADLPAGAKIRVSIQWREPHDPDLSEADYRAPITPLKLQLVRQRDPFGEKSASDEIDLIAESEGSPERLQIDPNFGIYEHSLEVTLPAGGRYALRVEGSLPKSLRPPGMPTLDAQQIRWELRPRVYVESADGKGRVRLMDYRSPNGGVPVPADARSVVTVGAAGPDGKARSASSNGAGPLAELAVKPNLLSPDYLPKWNDDIEIRGTMPATAFTAGLTASLLSAGVHSNQFPSFLSPKPGGVIRIPEEWLKR
ncbi:S8/S53 family peptidase [Zavarzinella formosa]|uniref:hypothetical protein n=1 Tax=Zavarzinella formosa TaxID=360055 RepID=UPI0012FB610A|nr:hypothetical protein [Zavarzinella formosa]